MFSYFDSFELALNRGVECCCELVGVQADVTWLITEFSRHVAWVKVPRVGDLLSEFVFSL